MRRFNDISTSLASICVLLLCQSGRCRPTTVRIGLPVPALASALSLAAEVTARSSEAVHPRRKNRILQSTLRRVNFQPPHPPHVISFVWMSPLQYITCQVLRCILRLEITRAKVTVRFYADQTPHSGGRYGPATRKLDNLRCPVPRATQVKSWDGRAA
jgi:hypothetical protein